MALADYASQVFAVTDAELRKLRHDPIELAMRAVQPALWLLLFGQVMGRIRGLTTGDIPYQEFLAPGILAQSVLFVAIFHGIAAIWERDLGIVHRYLVSPAPRSALVLGKALSSGARGLIQAVIVYLIALALGVHLDGSPAAVLGVGVFIVLGAGLFSTFSLIVACIVRTRERFMGIGQVLTMPVFFASNAIYPIDLMPPWLQTVARLNPLSYEVDALRTLMLARAAPGMGLGLDAAVLAGTAAVLVAIAARVYPRMAR